MAHPLEPYPTPEAREAEARALAAKAGAEEVRYGASVEGRPLIAFRLPSPGKPRVLCAANIHGVEWIANRVAHGLFEALAAGRHAELRERAEIWIAPCLNPDGHAKTFERGGVGPVPLVRTNAHGVDLNRNFPLPHGAKHSFLPTTGSDRKGRFDYRGEAPFSEPETAALDALFVRERFHAVLSLHSFMGTLIPARVLVRPEYQCYDHLAAEFARAQGGARYRRLGSLRFDVFTGELEDHVHHVHRGWATCVEHFTIRESLRQHLRAPNTFWRFNPRRPEETVKSDVPALVAFFQAALSLPRPGEDRG